MFKKICLDVRDYCHECDAFEAEVIKRFSGTSICHGSEEIKVYNTVVCCANRKRCEALKRYLEKQLGKDSNE